MQEIITIGEKYSRKDIYKIFDVPKENQGGNWYTGYNKFNDQYFIFVNIDSAGRTGHNYHNKLLSYKLEWYSKNNHNLASNSIKELLNASDNRYIFTRNNSNDPSFIYRGHGVVEAKFDQTPAKIIWDFSLDHI